MATVPKKQLGEHGELTAIDFLRRNGYRIVQHHARTPYGEIDIIARKGRGLFFVEVKTRHSDQCGDPFEAVSARKRKRIILNARWYLGQVESGPMDIHFSVIGIDVVPPEKGRVRFLEDAFVVDDFGGFYF